MWRGKEGQIQSSAELESPPGPPQCLLSPVVVFLSMSFLGFVCFEFMLQNL